MIATAPTERHAASSMSQATAPSNADLIGSDRGNVDMMSAHALCASLHITVNGLAIVHDEPNIADYYRQYVITGKGAFVIVANGVVDFARAIRKKLVQEIT